MSDDDGFNEGLALVCYHSPINRVQYVVKGAIQ
jgi:hypothetical protein